MIEKIFRSLSASFTYLRNKTRPLRHRRKESIKQIKRLLDLSQGSMEILAWTALQNLLAQPRYSSDEKRLIKFGHKVYSQADEDGILQEIFRRIGTFRKTFIEIGVGNGLENNTLSLLLQGWNGAWIEGNPEFASAINKKFRRILDEKRLRLITQWVSRENINQLIRECGQDDEVDLFSIDIDGNDFHVVQAIEKLNARVIVVEYNAKFSPPIDWTIEYNPHHQWDRSDYAGASLKALELLLRAKGYRLVGCNIVGSNAFFVRKDLAGDHFKEDDTAEAHYEPARYWIISGFMSGHPANFGPYKTFKDLSTSSEP
jgi:hypothetical protein